MAVETTVEPPSGTVGVVSRGLVSTTAVGRNDTFLSVSVFRKRLC